ncbi:DUF3376 domain-containing protein [Amnibacterium sp.]|uniref:DUF3376 domain-containing protein n=1 Tax=Amnibacterium sp. TaxID=1872496 RepID=UPI002621DF95|nr:DUF3376 domain-containing protein [Amnibacterium sp.]MCU1473006.1 Patatin [Amnibacterium sp.]
MAEVDEHRLALVLNGGISLAIWMGGVANELDLVRRASWPGADEPPMTEPEREVFTLWRRACEGKPRVVVDVIAGTSAGGLNGVFLATAIARNGTLGSLRALWMDRAQLDGEEHHLLDPSRTTVNSVLNGAAFLGSVVDGLQKIAPIGDEAGEEEVTLVTTASAVGGPSRVFRDSQGTRFELPDHRRRYRFRSGPGGFVATSDPTVGLQRGDDVRDFGPETAAALAEAARATASIPGVFDPVEESPMLRQHRRLPVHDDGGPADWLLDGGLLDNAPFDAVLDAIGKRSVDATWKRSLAYIVPSAPDPEIEQELAAQGMPSWAAIVPKIFTYPGEANLRDGIDRLDAMMNTARPDVDVQRFVQLVTGNGAGTIVAGAEALFPYYRAAAASVGIAEAYDAASDDGVQSLQPEPWGDDLSAVVDGPQTWLPNAFAYAPGDLWHWGVAPADRLVRLFLRSIRTSEGDEQNERRRRLHVITEELHAIARLVREALASQPAGPASAADIAVELSRIHGELGVPQRVRDLVDEAAGLVAAGLGDPVDPTRALRAGLSLEVVNGAPGLPVDATPTPVFDFFRFDVRLPLDLFGLATLQEQRKIANASDILYGTRLGHFAAFGSRKWREWDWLWGRISATLHLCELLGVPDQAAGIIRAIVEAEGTSEVDVTKTAKALLTGDGTTGSDLFTQMRKARGTVGVAAGAALRMGDRWWVSPSLTGVAGSAGSVVATILGREMPRSSKSVHPPPPAQGVVVRVVGYVGRVALAGPRWVLWWWLGR